MFRSTEDQDSGGPEVVSSDGMATPYFMLIQMNNAALLEAYATLGIQAAPAEIKETQFPDGFSAVKALSPIPFGEKDEAEHPGKIHAKSLDPIKEAESTTNGKASGALALGQKVAGRFGGNSGSGGDFKALIEAAMAAASLPQLDFDPGIFGHGSDVIGNTSGNTSVAPNFGGSAAFAGLQPDYRPETAPTGPSRKGERGAGKARHEWQSVPDIAKLLKSMQSIVKTRQHHLKGAARINKEKGRG